MRIPTLLAASLIMLWTGDSLATTCGPGDGGIAVYPGRGSVGVPRNAELAVIFDKVYWYQDLEKLVLLGPADASVPALVERIGTCCGTLRVRPAASLEADADYRLLWTRTPPDAGVPDLLLTSFSTGPGEDLTPPAFAGIQSARFFGPQFDPSPRWDLELGPTSDDATPTAQLYFRVYLGRDGGTVDRTDAGALIPSLGRRLIGDAACLRGNLLFGRHEVLNVEIEAVDWAGNGSPASAWALVPTEDAGYVLPDGGPVRPDAGAVPPDGGQDAGASGDAGAVGDAGADPDGGTSPPPEAGNDQARDEDAPRGLGCATAPGAATFALGVLSPLLRRPRRTRR